MAEYNPSKIIKDGNTYNFRDTTKIPLAGTNALAGSIVPNMDNSYDLGSSSYKFKRLYAPNLYGVSTGALQLFCNQSATDGSYAQIGYSWVKLATVNDIVYINLSDDGGMIYKGTFFYPGDVCKLGIPSSRWKEIWCTESSINSSSDERQKQQIKPIDNDLLDAWENVNPIQFKWNDAVAEKGNNARVHTGYIAQNIQQALTENGVNPNDYGLFLYDEWSEEQEEKDEQGNIIKPYKPSGNAYGLRYTEALIVECAYLRKKLKELTARIEQLEKRNNVK